MVKPVPSRRKRIVAVVVAYMLLLPIFLGVLLGRVRVKNYRAALRHVYHGKLLLIVNHPTLVETVAVPALFWWLSWFGKGRVVPWSVADQHLFSFPWLYPSFRCIPVARGAGASKRENALALRQVVEQWGSGGSVILYPEGGRTAKGTHFFEAEGRRVRQPEVTVVALAARKQVPVLPVWIEQGDTVPLHGMAFGYFKLFVKQPMRITFGEPRLLTESEVSPEAVAHLLLSV